MKTDSNLGEMTTNDLISRDPKFRYQMLGRLQADCEYYLNQGNRNPRHLWAGNEQDHIKVMESIWNSFSKDDKPEWITWEQIHSYKHQIFNKLNDSPASTSRGYNEE